MRFSIIMPAFHRAEEIKRALESCMEQTFDDFEVIVIDDSAPELEPICRGFNDPRIKYVPTERRLGIAPSRNIGLDTACGEYITFLDTDDIYYPNRLQVMNEFLKSNGARLAFHRQKRVFTEDGIAEISPPRLPIAGERLDDFILLNGFFIQSNSFVVERELALSLRFDTRCIFWEDTRYFIECWMAAKDYAVCEEVLSAYHDINVETRCSKNRSFEKFVGFLNFVETSCSERSAAGTRAMVYSVLSFWRHPFKILKAQWQGYMAGIGFARCAVFLLRTIIGMNTVEAIVYFVRRVQSTRSPAAQA